MATKFYGKRTGFDDGDADIKWPELKHGGDDSAAMQPLPARRTGGAGFDMGDEISETGHNMHSVAPGAAPDYSPPLGADLQSMSDAGGAGAYGAKLGHHDSYAASTTQLTGPGGAPGGGYGASQDYLGAPQDYHTGAGGGGYYDHYGQPPMGGIDYSQQQHQYYSDQDPHSGAGDVGNMQHYMDDDYGHGHNDDYGHGQHPQQHLSNPYR